MLIMQADVMQNILVHYIVNINISLAKWLFCTEHQFVITF